MKCLNFKLVYLMKANMSKIMTFTLSEENTTSNGKENYTLLYVK